MPTYIYRREDGSTFEIEQRITEPALTHDPETGQRVQRVIAGAGLLFKGSGFYLTDYARATSAKSETGSDAASDTGAKKPDTTPAPSSSPTTAPAVESKSSSREGG